MLREYQSQAIADLRQSIANGNQAHLLVAPTGSGKTAIAAAMIRGAREKCLPVQFLAPRRELIYQTSERLQSERIDHGVIMAGESPSMLPSVQVASIPTLHARAIQRERIHLPKAKLLLVDEAHIGIGGRAQGIIEHYREQGSYIIGLTATPARTDGRGLGDVYDDMVMGPSVAELTAQGYLVPSRYFTGNRPDLEGVKVQGGDYQVTELGHRADEPTLVGDVVSNWLRLARDRQTFVFAVNVAHSRHLAERFREHGVAAEHIDGHTELEERKAIHRRLQSGETQVVCNCQVYTYGVDYPPVSCIVLACPTKSITKYMQMVGRGLRTHPGKSDCMVLDHAGAVDEIGFVDDPMPWTLDSRKKVQEERQSKEYKQPDEMKCPRCTATFKPAKQCPSCGEEMGATYSRAIEAYEAELAEIDRKSRKAEQRSWSMDEKRRFYGMLRQHALNQGWSKGWAYHKYLERVGCKPSAEVEKAPKMQPDEETAAWIKHKQIQWAKSKRKTEAA